MSLLWIADAQGRVLGPVEGSAVRALVASGRMGEVARISRDGRNWVGVAQAPELLGASAAPPLSEAAERERALQLRELLAKMRQQPAHEVLGVAADATLDQHRTAFFALVKRYHPARLPPQTQGELRAACKAIFDYLGALMQQTEKRLGHSPADALKAKSAAVARPLETAPRPARAAPLSSPAAPATYRLEDFVGFSDGRDVVEATIRVNLANVGIFTDHSLANFSSGGVFLPSDRNLPLGTMLDLRFVFEQVQRRVEARGRVIWENAGAVRKLISGVGVRFIHLATEDKQFIQSYLAEVPAKSRQVLRF